MSCIISPYAKMKTGYAAKWNGVVGKMQYHHRFVYEQHNGPIPKGMVIMHTCDNPPCINIDHLRLGTHKDNCDDKVNKDRHVKGTQCKKKLTDQEVLNIRTSTAKVKDLAIDYGVSISNIYFIKARKIWKHI